MATNLTIAQTIADQIGKAAFFMMGSRGSLVGSDRSLSFKVCGCPKISHISITLNGMDTYDLEFIKCRKFERKVVETRKDVYTDNLHSTISEVTGLALSIPRIVGMNA